MVKEQWEISRHSKMTAGYQGRNDGGSPGMAMAINTLRELIWSIFQMLTIQSLGDQDFMIAHNRDKRHSQEEI